ncbi:MAG: RluA family pseudouridine synthase [Pseudomonadota bacterium]|nr:RluA family pseudouridine synthase [Pseudomonadota bacterium]
MDRPTLDAPHRILPITDRAAGRRADVFLSLRFNDWSRTALAGFIRSGHVVSDTRRLKPSTTLKQGEVLRIYIPGIAPHDEQPPMPPVLWEDEWLLAVDKPSGLLMHPVGQRWSWGLVGVVRRARPGADIDLAHRLDRETSGVVLVTKHADANRHLKKMFAERKVGKVYWALVRGTPTWDEHICDAALGHAEGSEVVLRQGASVDGAQARTRFKVVHRIPGGAYSLVACKPVTGRTHQIRAHLEHVGFPILGDKLYGQKDDVFLELLEKGATARVRELIGFPRHALHARSIAFPHPKTGQIVRVRAPLPPDLRAIVHGGTPIWGEAPVAPAAPAEDGVEDKLAE